MKKISIILCTYNRIDKLKMCLDRLPLNEMREYDVELLVVDNGSPDRTEEIVREFFKKTEIHGRYLWEPEKGLANARNAGLLSFTGDIAILLDDDCYLEKTISEVF